ncbi:DinB family protein [Mucilaginibacter sp.]|uniref:DinB family protein n=1 Tax=Mucilaginibacter sp. TaxID=1882438 RepID=UPI00284062DD|nr:DinB family protein [Mucilaginibacter sp.]MDR3697015.1 DinB family protein [Mucilaginibacter sp.]
MIKRPQPDEYSAFAARYVDLVGNGPIIEILEYLQQMTYNFFLRIDPDKAAYAYAEGKWTIKQVVGHITDTERVFAYRALAFSREAVELPGFDQDVYMAKSTFNTRSLEDLANEYNTVRESTLYLLRSFTEEQTTQKGIASGNPVSVRALAYMIAGHEMHHIKLLKERYL